MGGQRGGEETPETLVTLVRWRWNKRGRLKGRSLLPSRPRKMV